MLAGEETAEARKVEITKRRADWEVESSNGSRESSSQKQPEKVQQKKPTLESASSYSKASAALWMMRTVKTKTKHNDNDNDLDNQSNNE